MKKDTVSEIQEVIKRCAAANGTTPEGLISELLVELRREDRHPVHVSASTHRVNININEVRKLIWKDDLTIREVTELTGISANTVRRMATFGGRTWAKTAWKLATAFGVPLEKICDIKKLRGIVVGWEDTRRAVDQKDK